MCDGQLCVMKIMTPEMRTNDVVSGAADRVI